MEINPYINNQQFIQPNVSYDQNIQLQHAVPIMYCPQQPTTQQPLIHTPLNTINYGQHQINMQTLNQAAYNRIATAPRPQQLRTSDEWQQQKHANKRLRSPEDESQNKQIKAGNYWLRSKIPTQNRFSVLENDEPSCNNEPINESTNEFPKPPPIFIDGVENIEPLNKLLNEIAPDKYTVKALNNEKVKIQPQEGQIYTKIIMALNEKNTQYHTYKHKAERSYRVVLKNIHHSTNGQEIIDSLQQLGHEVTNVWNIKQRGTNKQLPMFFVDLKQANNNKDIYKIKRLMNSVVTFEAPHVKRDIPQCQRCQRFGHTKNYCHNNPRCVKCIGNHHTNECPRKTRDDEVQCVNCKEKHPANYRGCAVHLQLQEKLCPKLNRNTGHSPIIYPQFVQPGISYAEKTRQSVETNHIPQIDTAAFITTQQGNDMTE